MSAHATAEAPSTAPTPELCGKYHFLLRRLHSLTGILPVGVFLCFHLFTNFQMLVGNFQHEVQFIHDMPALLFIEIFGLWLPIGFHAALGVVYTFTGVPNSTAYSYQDNWRYTFQRITGILALLFIFVHVAKLRWGWTFGGMLDTPFYLSGPNGEPLAKATTAIALQHAFPLVAIMYVVGVYSCVYHFANGLWTAAITWGLTVSVAAQKRWGQVCTAVGVALAIFTAGAIYASLTYKVTDQERAMVAQLEQAEASGASMEAPAMPTH